MSRAIWLTASAVLLIGAIAPCLVLTAHDTAAHRLVGLQLISSVTTIVLVAVSLGVGRPDYLIVPFVLALLSFAGTLVYTRLIGASDG
ncbi:MrpF/PhaF family protein [Nocardia miyunensis]|uniref:MrpF/PhaF family protein n=1 Tax=Nocardia miyunensis TaxID=282684 RepID=UPI0008317168|nr:MrpF/PhaF family protein [Nocardia miyunensis]